MKQLKTSPHRTLSLGALALAGLVLSGCSSTPDWANPVEWYRGATGWFGDDDPKSEQARADAAAKDKNAPATKYPNLSSVPERPKDIASPAQTGSVQQGLVADRAQARHAALGPSDNRSALPAPSGPPVNPAPVPSVAQLDSVPPPPAAAPMPSQGQMSAASAASPAPTMAPPPPPAVMAPPPAAPALQTEVAPMPSDSGGVDAVFLTALNEQSENRVSAPRSGIRDANHSSVVASSGRGGLMPPPPRGSLSLQAPSSVQPISMAGGAGSSVGRVLFGNNSSKLSASDNKTLENIVKIKKERGGVLRVVGHASSRTKDLDPLRHRLLNFRLSLARAQAVANSLVRLGVPAKDVVVEARADNEPVYYEFMPVGEAGNRRAEIYLDY